MKRFIALILAALLLISCSAEVSTDEQTSATAGEAAADITQTEAVDLATRLSEYTIVRADGAGDSVTQACIKLRRAVAECCGAELTLATDWLNDGDMLDTEVREILVGHTNRVESLEAYTSLSEDREYIIVSSGTKIAVTGYDDSGTIAAVSALIAMLGEAQSDGGFVEAGTSIKGWIFPGFADTRALGCSIITPPTGAMRVKDFDSLALCGSLAPSCAVFDMDGVRLRGEENAPTVFDILETIYGKTVPVFRVEDEQSCAALTEALNAVCCEDAIILSPDEEILRGVLSSNPLWHGALDLTDMKMEEADDKALNLIRERVNKCGARIALLPSSATRYDVEYIQKLLVTVWLDSSDKESDAGLAALIASGAHGAVVSDFASLERVANTYFPDSTVTRRTYIVGHRGTPVIAPENTLESSLIAYQDGADIIENDVYLSADGQIVVMHDDTVDRMTDGRGSVESMTVEQLKALTITGFKGYDNLKVPTLAEYFEAFKDTDAHIFVEIKSGKTEICTALRALLDEYEMYNQVSVITFSVAQMKEMKRVLPEISVGYLTSLDGLGSDPLSIAKSVNALVAPLKTTFNPSYNGVEGELLTQLWNRGITLWPWTLNDRGSHDKLFMAGIDGITTNDAFWTADICREIFTESDEYSLGIGQTIGIAVKGRDYSRQEADVSQYAEAVVIEGGEYVECDGANVKGVSPGTAKLMLTYTDRTTRKSEYTLVTEIITIIVT